MTAAPQAARPLQFKIRQSGELALPRVSVLYEGDPFSYKTTYAASWPNLVAISFDPNIGALGRAGVRVIIPGELPDGRTMPPCKHVEDFVLPAIKNREIDATTIAIDSLTYMSKAKQQELGIQGRQGEGAKWAAHHDFFQRFMTTLTDAVKLGHYHVVCTVHETDKTSDQGTLISTRPSLPGMLRDTIAGFFEVVLLCEVVGETIVTPGTPPKSERRQISRVYTRSPDNFRVCGDRYRGPGRDRPLPPILDDGSYATLAKHWGLTTDNNEEIKK